MHRWTKHQQQTLCFVSCQNLPVIKHHKTHSVSAESPPHKLIHWYPAISALSEYG